MSATAPRLQFVLRPISGRRTTCEFAVVVDDIVVWPARGADDVLLEAQIDDLLGYLTEFWKPLMLRQVYPIDVSPWRPSELGQAAEQRWAELPQAMVEAEEEMVSDFEEAHDLARCFAGIFELPSLWILRSGDTFAIETGGTLWKLPFDEVRGELSRLGDQICDHLAAADLDRWKEAIEAWQCRSDADGIGLLAWSAGLERSLAQKLIDEGVLEAPRDFDDAANDNDELRIAARMAGALSPEQIREIVYLAREFDRRDAECLRSLAQKCSAFIARRHERARPFHQGEAAANFVREQLELSSDRRVEVFDIAFSLGMDIRHRVAEPPTLDGLAVWGERHGPGVFLNEASRRIVRRENEDIKQSAGARVTLAHELCHLLLDGGHALSAVEVLRARMPAGVEQRAKSFAGEFLLPSRVAAQHWMDAGDPRDRSNLDILLTELVDTFGVTRSVAAWKLEHAASSHEVDLSLILDALAPHR
jgi:Zn-dependent peptidase ImmA (M78 family)